MDEARRFLRFVLPGFVYAVETTLFTWILFPAWTVDKFSALREDIGLGAAIAAIFTSGALGYLFGVAHHFVHNRFSWLAPADHRNAIDVLIANNNLLLVDLDVNGGAANPHTRTRTREEALRVLTSLWYQRLRTSEQIAGAEHKLDMLHDVAHSSGAARVAAVFALATTLVIAAQVSHLEFTCISLLRSAAMVVAAALSVAVFWETYYRIENLAQRVTEQVLADVLVREAVAAGRPTDTHVIL